MNDLAILSSYLCLHWQIILVVSVSAGLNHDRMPTKVSTAKLQDVKSLDLEVCFHMQSSRVTGLRKLYKAYDLNSMSHEFIVPQLLSTTYICLGAQVVVIIANLLVFLHNSPQSLSVLSVC